MMQTAKQTIKKPEVGPYVTKEQNFWRVLQTIMRKRRFEFFKSLISSLPLPLHILDVGGTQEFWEKMEFIKDDVKIVIYNLSSIEVSYPSLLSMAGDARDMREFKDKEFEVVFSNSVIEHVGTYEQQRQMAEEVQRVGRRYCVQTPNRFFPIEPHVLLPFFQFLPFNLKVFILSHFRTPWGWKISSEQEAIEYVNEIRLLTEKELRSLFPGARIHKEKFLGLTKSLVVYKE
jgi:ubiquinone/menaquinone biosynthesis C-methylase UbiE